jgi:NADPH:quinone reductase-like Zn-dependent oxidoreductase
VDGARALGATYVGFDTLGGDAHARSESLLKPGGKLVYVRGDPIRALRRPDVEVLRAEVAATRARLGRILGSAITGALKPHIERIYCFGDAPAMYAASQRGHTRGKLVLAT